MRSIQQGSSNNSDDFPTLQLFLLGKYLFSPLKEKSLPADFNEAIVRLAEPIALTSVFPYAWQLVKRFKVGSEEDASTYSGLLISSFALAEAVMGMYWGGLSDRIGRKPILLVGCFGTMISMLILGFSSNIWVALFGRLFGGALNGNIGVIQTMVAELVKKPEHVSFPKILLRLALNILSLISDRNVSEFRFLFRHAIIENDTDLCSASLFDYAIRLVGWNHSGTLHRWHLR